MLALTGTRAGPPRDSRSAAPHYSSRGAARPCPRHAAARPAHGVPGPVVRRAVRAAGPRQGSGGRRERRIRAAPSAQRRRPARPGARRSAPRSSPAPPRPSGESGGGAGGAPCWSPSVSPVSTAPGPDRRRAGSLRRQRAAGAFPARRGACGGRRRGAVAGGGPWASPFRGDRGRVPRISPSRVAAVRAALSPARRSGHPPRCQQSEGRGAASQNDAAAHSLHHTAAFPLLPLRFATSAAHFGTRLHPAFYSGYNPLAGKGFVWYQTLLPSLLLCVWHGGKSAAPLLLPSTFSTRHLPSLRSASSHCVFSSAASSHSYLVVGKHLSRDALNLIEVP